MKHSKAQASRPQIILKTQLAWITGPATDPIKIQHLIIIRRPVEMTRTLVVLQVKIGF